MDKETIITILLLIVSFGAKAVMDVLKFRYQKSVFYRLNKHEYWCPDISWANKYLAIPFVKELKPRFFGSTTFLVFLTDGYHLMQFIFLNTLFLAASLISIYPWYWVFIGIRIIYAIVFNVMFDKVLIKK